VVDQFDPGNQAISERLMDLWKQLLRVGSLGPDDDFFQLGGNSMLAVRMLGTVSARFGVRIDVVRFLQTPSIRTLSALVPAASTHRSTQAENDSPQDS
jgi:hypothetical protein